jgi:hypothetical protein
MAEKINAEKNFESSVGNTATEADVINRRKTFSSREVGITHPDNPGFLRLTDSGDIEIFAAPGVGIVINGSTRTVSIFADNIKFHCKDDGLKWNVKQFNSSATIFNEPALITSNNKDFNPGFKNADYYINNISQYDQEDVQPTVTIQGEYDYITSTNTAPWEKTLKPSGQLEGQELTQQELDEVNFFWEKNKQLIALSKQLVLDEFLKLKQLGYTIEQAKARLLEGKNV